MVEFTDEVLGRPDRGREHGDAALLARGQRAARRRMRDIVATIQAEQDEIIRLDHPGVLVIEGGLAPARPWWRCTASRTCSTPSASGWNGTVCWWSGPTRPFLNHIGRVLPSLGESDVVFITTGDLVPGLGVTAEDTPEAARLKGSLKILDVLAAAVADRQRAPQQPLPIELADVTVRIDAETAQWAIQEARASGLPHNEARAVFPDDRHVGAHRTGDSPDRPGLAHPRGPRRVGAAARRNCSTELADHDAVQRRARRAVADPDAGNPAGRAVHVPRTVCVLRAPTRSLWRADGEAWTVSDVPLLDELVDLLGRDKAAHRRRRRRAGTRAPRPSTPPVCWTS